MVERNPYEIEREENKKDWKDLKKRLNKVTSLLTDLEFEFKTIIWGDASGKSVIIELDKDDPLDKDEEEKYLSIDFHKEGRIGMSLIDKKELEENERI